MKYELYLGLAYEQRATLDKEHFRDWCLESVHCYQKAAEMSPANAYYFNDQGRVFSTLGRLDKNYFAEAEKAYKKSVQLAPSSPTFLICWATLLQKTGKNQEARDQIRKAFALDPGFSAKFLAQMALEEYKAGEKEQAFQYLDESIQNNTACAEAYYCRGILYLNEKKKKNALEDFEKIRGLNPIPEKNSIIQSLDQLIQQAMN